MTDPIEEKMAELERHLGGVSFDWQSAQSRYGIGLLLSIVRDVRAEIRRERAP